jgi:hypothetical protein
MDLGYQSLTRSYSSDVIIGGTDLDRITDTDEFKCLYLGMEVSYVIIPELKVLLGGELPVYSWSVRPMKDAAKEKVFFQAHAGVIWTLPAR